MDVAGKDGKVCVPLHKDALVPALVEVPHPRVPPVVITGIGNVEFAHEFSKVSQGCFDQKMEMVAHEDVAVKRHGITVEGLAEYLEESTTIGVVLEYVLPFVASAGDVVKSSGILEF